MSSFRSTRSPRRSGTGRSRGGRGRAAADDDLPRIPPALHRGQGRFLGGAGEARALGEAARESARLRPAAFRTMVRRRRNQPLPQRARPAPRRARKPEGARLYLHGDRRGEELELPRAPHRSAARCGDDALPRSRQRRPGRRLHAHDPGGGVRHSRLREDRRDPFGRIRRIRGREPRRAHRRRATEAHGHRRRRQPHGKGGLVQGTRRRGTGPREASAVEDRAVQPRFRSGGAHDAGPGPRLRRAACEASRRGGPLHLARIERAVLHPVYVRHDRQAQRRAARRRWIRRRARGIDEAHLLRRRGGDDVHHLGHRLGGGAFLHHLRTVDRGNDHRPLRGRSGAARRRDLVEDRAGPQCERDVLRADRDPRAEEARSGLPAQIRPRLAQAPFPRGRAARRADARMDRGGAGQARDRPLLADRDGLADPHFGSRRGKDAHQARQPELSRLRLRAEAPARGRCRRGRDGRESRGRDRAAPASGMHVHRLG